MRSCPPNRLLRYLACCLAACYAALPGCATAPLAIAGSSPLATLPLEITAQGLLLVPVTLADGSVHPFLLDSGARVTLLTPERVADLGLHAEDEGVGRGIGEQPFAVGSVHAVRLGLGTATLTLPRADVAAVALPGLPPASTFGGILGSDLFRRFVVELDFVARTVTLRDPASWRPPAGAQLVPFALRDDMAYLPVVVTPRGGEPITARVGLDTGFPRLLRFYRPFVDGQRLLAGAGADSETRHGTAMGGATSYVELTLAAAVIAGHELRQPVVVCSRERTGIASERRHDGLLGTAFLRRFRVSVDYAHRVLALAPLAPAAA